MGGVAVRVECPACSKLSNYVDNEVEWHRTRCGLVNREKLTHIHIVGGPGSGKTTLAHLIGASLNIDVFELDLIAFTGLDYAERALSERLNDVSIIANRPAWITEGLFIQWTNQLLECADVIVWLDHMSWGRSMWRTVLRFTRSALHGAKNRRGLSKFTRFQDYARHLKQLIQVFFSSRVYYADSASENFSQVESRKNTAKQLSFYKSKVVHCYDDEGVTAFLNYIQQCCCS